jgi:hypothetical protein
VELNNETKARTANKVLPKAGLNGFNWAFVQGSTFVLRLSFCAKNPAFGNTQNVVAKSAPLFFFNLSAKRIFCSLIQSSFFLIKTKNLSKFERFPFYKFVKIICFP